MFLLNSFEIIGTIAFAISGAVTGIEKKLDLFGITFLAIITAVGGGMIRDIFVGNVPFVLKREIYAMESITGAVCFYAFYDYLPETGSLYLCCAIVFIIRMVAVIRKINLPTALS